MRGPSTGLMFMYLQCYYRHIGFVCTFVSPTTYTLMLVGEAAEQGGKQQLGGDGGDSGRFTRHAVAHGAQRRVLQWKVGGVVINDWICHSQGGGE